MFGLVFLVLSCGRSHKDNKPLALSPVSSLYWLTGDVKETTKFLQRVGYKVPDVMVWPC